MNVADMAPTLSNTLSISLAELLLEMTGLVHSFFLRTSFLLRGQSSP